MSSTFLNAKSTLHQIFADLASLPTITDHLVKIYQPQDAIILLGETALLVSWFLSWFEQKSDFDFNLVKIFVLAQDLNQDFVPQNGLEVLSDEDWVILAQSFDRVITHF